MCGKTVISNCSNGREGPEHRAFLSKASRLVEGSGCRERRGHNIQTFSRAYPEMQPRIVTTNPENVNDCVKNLRKKII